LSAWFWHSVPKVVRFRLLSVSSGTGGDRSALAGSRMKVTLLAAAIIIAIALMLAPAFVKSPPAALPVFDSGQLY
jgi:hypothetical protein